MIGYAIDQTAAVATALTRSLDELARLIADTGDETYLWKPEGGVSGTIGAHVRHILDHVTVLLECPQPATVTYDHRQRDTRVEHDRTEAIRALRGAAARLESTAMDDRELTLEAVVERGQAPIAVATSLARELVFALQHTIHHQAIIALLLHEVGAAAPARFGYAPSTPVR